jgi:hypothetical protein
LATPFRRSLRSLHNDGFRLTGLALALAGALVLAWGAWFVLARVSVYAVTSDARLEVGREAYPISASAPARSWRAGSISDAA